MKIHIHPALFRIICCLTIICYGSTFADDITSDELNAKGNSSTSGDASKRNSELSANEKASTPINPESGVRPPPKVEIKEAVSDIPKDSIQQPYGVTDSKNDLIKFAGVWIRGNAADASKVCPVGIKYAMGGGDNEAAAAYSGKLLQLIRSKQKLNGLRLIDRVAPDDYLPQAGSGRALVLACAINYEITEDGVLPSGVIGCFGEIGFDLIICDFSDRRIVFSIPCRLVFQEHAKKSDLHLIKLYEQYLPQIFLKLAGCNWNVVNSLASVGIGTVTILQPKNTKDLPANVVDVPERLADRIEMLYAQIAASRFFDATGIPIQPYSKGEEAVFYGLQENLADASSLIAQKIREEHAEGVGFLLKKPDYKIDLKGLFARQKQGGAVNYTSLGKVVITDRGGNEIHNVQYDACADLIPYRPGVNQDVWHYSADASVRLFQKFANSLCETRAKEKKIELFFKDCSPE